MFEIMIRYLQKKTGDMDEISRRTAYGIFTGTVGIFCNICLFVIKFVVGLLARSMSVTADAFNNLSDAGSSIISVVGSKMAGKPADKDHPFGHGRVEYLAALVVSFLIIEVGIQFLKGSIEKIRHPQELQLAWFSLLFLGISILVKLWMFALNRKMGKITDSSVMKATAMDSLFDAVITSVTIASLVVYQIWGWNIDGYAGLLVSLIVIYAGVGVIKDTISPLIGGEMDPGMYERVESIVKNQEKVISTHDLVIHNYGPNRSMATIHVEVPRKMSIVEAHEVADAAENAVRQETGIQLVAHVDPVALDDERVVALRKRVKRILAILDPNLTFHDFQADISEEEIVIRFDLAIPYAYDKEAEEKICHQIDGLLRECNPLCRCEILVDRG